MQPHEHYKQCLGTASCKVIDNSSVVIVIDMGILV